MDQQESERLLPNTHSAPGRSKSAVNDGWPDAEFSNESGFSEDCGLWQKFQEWQSNLPPSFWWFFWWYLLFGLLSIALLSTGIGVVVANWDQISNKTEFYLWSKPKMFYPFMSVKILHASISSLAMYHFWPHTSWSKNAHEAFRYAVMVGGGFFWFLPWCIGAQNWELCVAITTSIVYVLNAASVWMGSSCGKDTVRFAWIGLFVANVYAGAFTLLTILTSELPKFSAGGLDGEESITILGFLNVIGIYYSCWDLSWMKIFKPQFNYMSVQYERCH